MPRVPAPADPGQGVPRPGARPEPECWEPVITRPDPVSLEEWLSWDVDEDEPPDFDEDDLDPEGSALPWDEDLAAIVAETDLIAAERAADAAFLARAEAAELAGAMLADEARKRGPRGPGLPGSAERIPGVSSGPAGGFGAGECLDVAAGSAVLHGFAEKAVDSGRLAEASDDEVIGLIGAADRVEASACSLKHVAVAELLRRRPAPGAAVLEDAGRMPEAYLDSAAAEVKWALAETRATADGIASLAWDLEVKLPGTRALFRDGRLRHSKVVIIARETAVLDADEARQAEGQVLGQAPGLSPGQLRIAIKRAVKRVAPGKAKDRREHGAKNARVERWAEDSGNAGLAIREAPPARVLAADGRVTWWARQLRAAGIEGGMDMLRARAALDLLLNYDSRPAAFRGTPPADDGADHPAGPYQAPGSGGGPFPAGFVGRNHLTVPLATLLGLTDRPGELPGLGPVDPWLARDLAAASAANPKTSWCLTVTDSRGRAEGHACARPEPRRQAPPGPDPPGFTVTQAGPGPPGGYGTWRFTTGVPGQRTWIFTIDPIPAGDCDHRYEASGHDPGVKLRHLTQIRHATCTGPMCERPSGRADFEHNIPYDKGGRTCLCNAGPKCRHEHRLKQDPKWKVEQHPDGSFTWTTPSGRQYTTGPTEYPI
ncbi:MAG TPA: DUF222 domain-containing protein [Streptosporangiaceae bacterium]|nr:DUF222 domain-containing protein [Streptosporangiaceae bacterium]